MIVGRDSAALSHVVFVYGTLKSGFPNHEKYMKTAVPIGEYKTVLRYPLVLCGERYSPCMINSPGHGLHVRGELYEIDAAGLKRMDALERIHEPDGYRRHAIRVAPWGNDSAGPKTVQTYLKDYGVAGKGEAGFRRSTWSGGTTARMTS